MNVINRWRFLLFLKRLLLTKDLASIIERGRLLYLFFQVFVQVCRVDGLQPTVAPRVLNHKEKKCVVAV